MIAPSRAILSLDGGGVRGAISVAFLERIEQALGAGRPAKLAEKFDLIGGTSTGAIIAGALALGFSAADVKELYVRLAPKVFRRDWWRLVGVQSVFDAAPLRAEIAAVCGDRTLDTPDLKTGLAVFAKRMDTGGAWIVTNNPKSKYWDDPADDSYLGNRHYRIGELIRASTAAPHYFAPQPVEIVKGAAPGWFVDGGVTPFNNPALALFQVATLPAYGYGWPMGAEALTIVSVGTGVFREQLDGASLRWMTSLQFAIKALTGLIQETSQHTLATMQSLGRSLNPWPINSEIGDLGGGLLADRPLFTFVRYDVRLEQDWLADRLGLALSPRDVARLRRLDDASAVPLAYEIGRRAAEAQVRAEHFGTLAR
ncbi:patatin-like phospholipase family protein [Methylopila sp. M107]|uniref:patatin-like phospholipase family protein n=1 Tax=Methylopila sp. M107 TaxID=1101190 RepID=UPI0003752A29|nr:patatin-like phospholipase family protein [Methylopila sp. M107]